jgi:hypothetical protein
VHVNEVFIILFMLMMRCWRRLVDGVENDVMSRFMTADVIVDHNGVKSRRW